MLAKATTTEERNKKNTKPYVEILAECGLHQFYGDLLATKLMGTLQHVQVTIIFYGFG